ncbi:MAG TPA: aldose epimerase family protein [Candidatus Binatia bacterium]|nr:aldose epimerase family protein [Candidatus Binatia bacterium]
MATSARTWTLRSPAGIAATVMDFGATLTALHVPDREGRGANVVLGFPDAAAYRAHRVFFGATVGRVANRIAGARFVLDGREYRLTANEGPNHLHGGALGFDRVGWRGRRLDGTDAVEFTHTSADGDEGYPGMLAVRVVYALAGTELRLDYEARTDRTTIVAPTNHSYFNLAAAGDVLGHELEVAADRYTPVDAMRIPTGEIAPVAGTPFDFTRPTTLGARFDSLASAPPGYDHNFVLRSGGGRLEFAARLTEPRSGRVIEVSTTEPGLQLYTGNYLDGSLAGADGRRFVRHAGVCLETQHFPDAVHHPQFPAIVLEPGRTLRSTTVYRFAVGDAGRGG